MKSEQEMLDRIKGHSCKTLLLDTFLGQSCGALFCDTLVAYSLWGTLAGHFYETLLPHWHSCSTLLWHTLAKHSLSILWNTLVRHSCWKLLLDTSGTLHYKASTQDLTVLLYTAKFAQNNSRYYFVLQTLHKGTSRYHFVLQSLHKALPSIT